MAQRFRHTEMMELESPDESEHRLPEPEESPAAMPKRVVNIPHLGIIMAIASSFFFSLSSLIVKLVPDVHPVALATYRFAGILLPSLPIVIRRVCVIAADWLIVRDTWEKDKQKKNKKKNKQQD